MRLTRTWPFTGVVVALGCILASCSNEFLSCDRMSTCSWQEPLGGSGNTDDSGGGGAGGAGGAGSACKAPCEAVTPYCDEERGQCVACRDNGDCTDTSAPRCEAGQCVRCAEAAECAGRPGTTACDVIGGGCVECTAADESACGDTSCDPARKACTGTPRGNRQPCETCVADSECGPDHRCVPMKFQGEPREDGYCLKLLATACEAPFQVPTPTERTSLSGAAPALYCGVSEKRTTCEAVRALIEGKACSDVLGCGAWGLDDARCETLNDSLQCTYSCTGDAQCPGDLVCGPDQYCQPEP